MNEMHYLFNNFMMVGFDQASNLPYQQCANVVSTSIVDWITALAAILGAIASCGTLWIAFQAINDWKKAIDCKVLTKAKENLVYSIIDLVSTLASHCTEDPVVSCKSELDSEIYNKLNNKEENYVAKERSNIDIEITNKFRVLNKNIRLFEFYISNKNREIVKEVEAFKVNLWNFAQSVNMLIILKFSLYYNHENNNYFYDKFTHALKEIQEKLRVIESEVNVLLEKLSKN